MNVMEELKGYGLIPVTVLDDAAQAVPLAEALEQAGLPVAEITLRTQAGLAAIAAIRQAKPHFLLGAGTVRTLEQCRAAVDAGASYIVSPGFQAELVRFCIERNVAVIPGCVTPSELEQALEMGIHVVKFFPASTYGGVGGCKALYGPYASAGVRFIPTGGIGPDNLTDYADKPFIHAVGGGWLTPTDAVRSGQWDRITAIAKAAVDQLLGFELAHVGINLSDEKEALAVSGQLEAFFGWPAKLGNSSIFSSSRIEVLKSKGRGTMGHLAVRTNCVDRALAYLERRGLAADPASLRRQGDRTTFAYLNGEIGGFAVHLLQK